MESSKKLLGERIRRFRKRLQWTQKDLAGHMGFTAAETISQMEKGEREVKAWELVKLAHVLAVEISQLLEIEEPKAAPQVLWRQAPAADKGQREAQFLGRCQQYATLEELSGAKLVQDFPQKKVAAEHVDFTTATYLAEEIRRELGLGEKPAGNLERTLEARYGVKVWYLDMEEGSAASAIGPFGPAILMNSKEAPWRRNYNFAHELFHLITWDSLKPALLMKNPELWEHVEKVANVFASCLLLPGDAVTAEFQLHIVSEKISYVDLVGIARSFDVSTEALLYRLRNLRLLTKETLNSLLNDPRFRSLDRSTMGPCWWTPPTFPERFVRLAFLAYQKGRLSKARLAQLLDTSLLDLADFLQDYGLDDREGYDTEICAA
jgi:Zn-dependent peptidase ImmA (M78 family)/DNA-binding XRE family transcriptional regulator